jgi:putative membrane protein
MDNILGLPRRSLLWMALMGSWGLPAIARGQDGGPWGTHMMWNSWGIGMMIMMFLFWAAVIVAIVFFIRWLITSSQAGSSASGTPHADSALDILNKRYARGEISKQEFDDMRRAIQE